MLWLQCEGCGTKTTAFDGQVIHHAACPKRQPRKPIPQYLPIEGPQEKKVK